MKKIILAAAIAVSSLAANAQDLRQSEVPSLVLSALQSKFPNAEKVDWEKKGDLYKAEFDISRRDHDVWIDAKGNIVKHKEELTVADLPEAVSNKIKSDYKDYKIDDVDKVEANGRTVYVVELDGRTGDIEVTFSPDGKVVQP